MKTHGVSGTFLRISGGMGAILGVIAAAAYLLAPGVLTQAWNALLAITAASADRPTTSDHIELAALLLAGCLGLAAALAYGAAHRRRLTRMASHLDKLLAAGERLDTTEDPALVSELLRQLTATQRRAEKEWLAGLMDTEHMENLNGVYEIRRRDACDKLARLQLQRLLTHGEQIHALLTTRLVRVTPPAPPPPTPSPAKQEAAKPRREAEPPSKATAKLEDVEEGLPEILLPPEDGG